MSVFCVPTFLRTAMWLAMADRGQPLPGLSPTFAGVSALAMAGESSLRYDFQFSTTGFWVLLKHF